MRPAEHNEGCPGGCIQRFVLSSCGPMSATQEITSHHLRPSGGLRDLRRPTSRQSRRRQIRELCPFVLEGTIGFRNLSQRGER